MLATRAETAPFALELSQLQWTVREGAALKLPIHVARASEFNEGAKLRAYLDTQDAPLKEWDIDGKTVETALELDLKQAKASPGKHQLHFLAQTKGKIRRVRPNEAAALEEEKKKAGDARRKEIEEKLRLHDVSGTFSSPVIELLIEPAALAAQATATAPAGAK
jgi:hypothetical protein